MRREYNTLRLYSKTNLNTGTMSGGRSGAMSQETKYGPNRLKV